MSRKTTFLKLHLPEENEYYRVEEDQNQNFEKIDNKLKEIDSGKVSKSGDTMTGDLTIYKSNPRIKFNDNSDRSVDVSIGVEADNFFIREDEEGDKEWMKIVDDDAMYVFGNKVALDKDKEPKFTKNTAFNKNFGTTKGTVLEGSKLDLINKKIDKIEKTDGNANLVGFKNDRAGIYLGGGNEINFSSHNDRFLFNYRTLNGEIEKNQFHFLAGKSDGTTYANIYGGNLFNEGHQVWHKGNFNPQNYQTKITWKSGGNLEKSSSVTSDSENTIATSKAVKLANDNANSRILEDLVNGVDKGFEHGGAGMYVGHGNEFNYKSSGNNIKYNYRTLPGQTQKTEFHFLKGTGSPNDYGDIYSGNVFSNGEKTLIESDIEKVAGLEYEGEIQKSGLKVKGKVYFDKNTKKLYKCLKSNNFTSPSVDSFESIDNDSLLSSIHDIFKFETYRNYFTGSFSNVEAQFFKIKKLGILQIKVDSSLRGESLNVKFPIDFKKPPIVVPMDSDDNIYGNYVNNKVAVKHPTESGVELNNIYYSFSLLVIGKV